MYVAASFSPLVLSILTILFQKCLSLLARHEPQPSAQGICTEISTDIEIQHSSHRKPMTMKNNDVDLGELLPPFRWKPRDVARIMTVMMWDKASDLPTEST